MHFNEEHEVIMNVAPKYNNNNKTIERGRKRKYKVSVMIYVSLVTIEKRKR